MLKTLYYIALVTLVLGQLIAFSKSEGSNIYGFDLVVFLVTFIYVIYLLGINKKFVVPQPFYFLFIFLIVACISFGINSFRYDISQLLPSAFYIVRFAAYLLFTLSIYNLVLIKKLSYYEIITSIIWSAVFIVLMGIVQLIILPDFTKLDPSLGWDPHQNRLASTFFDPNFVGAYLAISFILLIDSLFTHRRLTMWTIIALLIISVGIVLTFSRSAWLMTGVAIILYGFFKKRILILVALAIMFLAYYSVPRIQTRISGTTDPADSAQFRVQSWNNTLKIIKDYPILGVGFNTLRYVQKDYGFYNEDTYLSHAAAGSDSSILFVMATTGIVGLLIFMLGILVPVLKTGNNLFIYKTVILSLLIESQFINALFYPQIMFLWMLLLAFANL